MDEAEARRLLAIAADDSDRPSRPSPWPPTGRSRRRLEINRLSISRLSISRLGTSLAHRLSRVIRRRCPEDDGQRSDG